MIKVSLINKVMRVSVGLSLAIAAFLLVRLNMLQNFTMRGDSYAYTKNIFGYSRQENISL